MKPVKGYTAKSIDMKTEPTEASSIKRANFVDKYLPVGDEQRYYQRLEMHEELIDLINSHSPKIKQLEWVLESGGWHISMTQFGVSYEIVESKNDGNFILYDILLTTTIHDTIDEAKFAAQADFEKRVRECLDL